ncbi:MAG: hypothetical protein Q6368_005050 [Candidatus Baldrarchaeota archaeon]|nr:hypothetical protein [Candidatus Baldrarchaeota archaeon]
MPKEKTYRCPLCGFKFTEKSAKDCINCPLAAKCSLIRCPNCGYEFPKI